MVKKNYTLNDGGLFAIVFCVYYLRYGNQGSRYFVPV